MREQDLIRRVSRTDELLHNVGWLFEDEHLYIIKGSKQDRLLWGVGVEEPTEQGTPAPLSTHPVLNKLPNNGDLGATKREMGDALATINSLLLAFAREKDALENLTKEDEHE